MHDYRILLGNFLAGVFLVGGSRVEVELGGMSGVEALEDDVSVAPADVECFLEFQLVAFRAYCDGSAASYIDYSDLPALGKILGAEDVGGR